MQPKISGNTFLAQSSSQALQPETPNNQSPKAPSIATDKPSMPRNIRPDGKASGIGSFNISLDMEVAKEIPEMPERENVLKDIYGADIGSLMAIYEDPFSTPIRADSLSMSFRINKPPRMSGMMHVAVGNDAYRCYRAFSSGHFIFRADVAAKLGLSGAPDRGGRNVAVDLDVHDLDFSEGARLKFYFHDERAARVKHPSDLHPGDQLRLQPNDGVWSEQWLAFAGVRGQDLEGAGDLIFSTSRDTAKALSKLPQVTDEGAPDGSSDHLIRLSPTSVPLTRQLFVLDPMDTDRLWQSPKKSGNSD
jgi:hypothetical protein